MKEINERIGTHISPHHSFCAEVNIYKKYVWRCDGKCMKTPPAYGYFRRHYDLPPCHRDRWWLHHEEICGGHFERIPGPVPFLINEVNAFLRGQERVLSTATHTQQNVINSQGKNPGFSSEFWLYQDTLHVLLMENLKN